MTIIELRDALFVEMEASIRETESRDYRRRGCLQGIKLCREFVERQDYAVSLTERHKHEKALQLAGVPMEQYWEYRSATIQIEWVFAVLSVAWKITPYSARAVETYNRLIDANQDQSA